MYLDTLPYNLTNNFKHFLTEILLSFPFHLSLIHITHYTLHILHLVFISTPLFTSSSSLINNKCRLRKRSGCAITAQFLSSKETFQTSRCSFGDKCNLLTSTYCTYYISNFIISFFLSLFLFCYLSSILSSSSFSASSFSTYIYSVPQISNFFTHSFISFIFYDFTKTTTF